MRSTPILLCFALSLLGRSARANDPAHATELFNEGRELLKQGAREEACGRFRESYALDARVGTQMNLASCEEAGGHLLLAHELWSKAAAAARAAGDGRESFAVQRDAAVVKRTPRLTIQLPPNAPPEARATLDGAPAGISSEVRVDPGEHTLGGTAAGRAGGSQSLTLAEGEQRAVTLDLGEATPASPSVAPQVPALAPPHEARPSSESPPRNRPTWMRPVGYGLGAAGIVGIGVGAYFGLDAIAKKNDSNGQGCEGNVCTNSIGYGLRNASSDSAGRATAAFIAGGIALAGGVALVLLAPRAAPPLGVASLRVVAGPGRLSLSGTF